jgi:dimethylsulfone monooxygenase
MSDGLGDRTAISPAEFSDSPLSRVLRQPLILGLFLPVQSGGWSASLLPRTTDWRFDYNAALTKRAERLGFDLVFGLAQWTSKGGYGGISKYREDSLDPFIAVAALSAITDRILLISTVHVLFGPWHPLHLAKFGATLDHISGGRWGINVVTGYAPSEARMFGGEQIEHDRRYEMAGEFTDILNRLWGETEDLTLRGKFWSIENAFVTPKPRFGRPILVNATGSPAGIDYAAAHSDLVFITSPAGHEIDPALAALPAHNAVIKAAGAARGRQLRTTRRSSMRPTAVQSRASSRISAAATRSPGRRTATRTAPSAATSRSSAAPNTWSTSWSGSSGPAATGYRSRSSTSRQISSSSARRSCH